MQTIDLQRVLDGEKAQRADAARRLADVDKRLALGDSSADVSQQKRQDLLVQLQRLSSQVSLLGSASLSLLPCHESLRWGALLQALWQLSIT